MARNYTGISNKAQNPSNNTVSNDQPQYTIPSSPNVSNEQPQYTIPPSPAVSKPTTRTTPKSPLVIKSVEDIPGVKKSSTPVPVHNSQQPGGASFYGGNKANTSGGAFSTVSNYLNTYTAPSLVTTEELEASKSGRQITPFAPNSMGWLGTVGTTGLSRNTAPGEKYTFFEITSEDNGLLFNTDGIFPWYDDNQARLNAVTTFALDNSTWRTADEMNSYAQEAANLYYDYGTMADEFKTRIDEIEAEFTKMQWPDDESRAWADDYLTQWRSNLEMVKQMQAQAKDVYDTLAYQNAEYGKYDDDKKYDINDAKYYQDARYGGDTPENLTAKWNELNREWYDTFGSTLELGAWAPGNDDAKRMSLSPELEEVYNNILLANERRKELEKYNTQLSIARDYLSFNTGDPDKTRANYEAEEARLLRITLDGGIDGGTGRMRTQDEDDRLEYIQEVLGYDNRARLEEQWNAATDEEIAARIEEITKGDKKTKSSDFNGADIVWGNIKLEGDKNDGYYVPDARTGGLLDKRESTTVQLGGKYVVIPLVVNDGKGWRKLTPEEAIQRYQSKDEFFGIFTTPEQAAEYTAELKNEKPEGAEEPFWVSQLPKEREYTPEEMMELTVLNLIQMARAGDEYQKLYDEYITKSGEAAGTKQWLDDAYEKYARLKALYEAPLTGEDSGYTYATNIFNQAKRMETDKWTDEQRTAHWEDLKSKLVDDYDIPQEFVEALDASGVKNLDEALAYVQSHAGGKNEQVAEEYKRAMQEYAWAQQYYEANLRNQKDYMSGLTQGMLMVNGMSNDNSGNKGMEALRDIVEFNREYAYEELAGFGLNITREDYDAFRDMMPRWTDKRVFTPYTEEDALTNPITDTVNGITVQPWRQDQVENYYYILGTEGLTAATKYAISVNSDLNAEYKNKMKARWEIIQKYEAERNPGSFYFGAAVEPWLTAIPSAFASVGDFAVLADQMATYGAPITTSGFSVNEWNEFSQSTTANQLATSLNSNFGISPALTTFLYNTYGSIAQSTEIMATGIGFSRMLGALGVLPVGEISLFGKSIDLAQHAASLVSDVTFFSGAATSTFRSLMEENPGIDPQKAWTAAVWAGVSEAAFEHISFDRLYDMVAKDAAAWSSWKDAFIHTMVSAGIEGSEELFTEFANALGEELTIGENSKFNKKVAYFRGMGISKESAERYALQETLKELGLAFAGGALSGFVTTGATSTVGHVKAGAYNTELGTRLNEVMDKSSNQSAGALFADYLTNALYTTEDMSYTQRQEIGTLRDLAKKVQDGTASVEETGRMVALAGSYDSKLVNDFILSHSTLWAMVQPIPTSAAFEEAMERLLGVEEARAYKEAKLKNPDAHVLNGLEQALIAATGSEADSERILEAESMLLNIVMGSDILRDGTTAPRMGMDVEDGADLIAEAVETGSLSGEDIQRAILTFFSNQQQRLQSAQNQGLRDMLTQNQAPAEIMASALTSQMEAPTVTAEMTADQVKAVAKDFLTKLWNRSNEAANDLLKQTKAFYEQYKQDNKSLEEEQKKTETIVSGSPDQGIADNRSGKDTVTVNGKTVTRDAYIASMRKGVDPFNNASITPLAEEEAQARFDRMIYQASNLAIPKAGMSAEMEKYDPKNKISKVETQVDTAKTNESTTTAEQEKEETTSGTNPNIGAKEQTMEDKAAGGTTAEEGPLPENQAAYNRVVNAINSTIEKLKNLKEDAVVRFKTAIQKSKGHQVTPVYGEGNTAYELEIGGKILHFEYKKGRKATNPYIFIKNEDGTCVDILHNTAQGDDRAKQYDSVADMVADNAHSDNGVTPAAEVLDALKNYSQNIYNTLREAWEEEERRLTEKLESKRAEEAALKAQEKTEEKSDVIVTEAPAEKPQLTETTEEQKPAEKGPRPIPTATEAEKILAEDKAAGSKEDTSASEQTTETTETTEAQEELPPTDEEIDEMIAAANKTADEIMDEEEVPAETPQTYTAEDVRGMDILATNDKEHSRGEGRSWGDSYTIFDPKTDGKRTITRAEYVASLMSGVEPNTGRQLPAPFSLAQALDLFDTEATLEMEYQFVKDNTNPAFSLTLDQIDRDLAELRRMKTWIASLETKEKGTTNPVTLNKIRGHLMDAYKWFENAVGKVLNDRNLTLSNARQKINDELSALKAQLNSIANQRRAGGPTSSLMQAEAAINKRVQALGNALKTLGNAEHFFNKYSGELEKIRQRMYATDYASYAGGENNGQTTSGSNPSGRVSDMGDTGSSVESDGNDSGRTEGSQRAQRPGERALTGSAEEVLREVGADLDGQVVFDSLGKTEKDVQEDKNLSPAVKEKVLKAMRSGVARILFTKGTLTQNGNAIHGFRDTVGNTKSLIIINDDSKFYQYLMNDKGTLYNYAIAKQLDHEFVHHMLALMGDGVRHNFMRTVLESAFSGHREIYQEVFASYLADYGIAYNFKKNGKDYVLSREDAEKIEEEIIADIYAGFNRLDGDTELSTLFDRYLLGLQSAVKLVFESTGLEKYSGNLWKGLPHSIENILDASLFSSEIGRNTFNIDYSSLGQVTNLGSGRNSIESITAGANLAAVYEVEDPNTGEKELTTFGEWLEKYLDQHPNETKDDAKVAFRKLERTGKAFVRGLAQLDANNKPVYDKNNFQTYEVKGEDVINTPLGKLITYARDVSKTITADEAKQEYEFVAGVLNLLNKYQDSKMVWEVTGTEQWAAIKNNSDPQYRWTIDFSTICKKTQAIIDAISGVMTDLGSGLSKEEIKYVYLVTGFMGESTPCPVCYVFSRWMGLGGVLDNIWKFQQQYGKVVDPDGTKVMKLAKDVQELAEKESKSLTFGKQLAAAQNRQLGLLGDAIWSFGVYDSANEEIAKLQSDIEKAQAALRKNPDADKAENLRKQIEKKENEIKKYQAVLTQDKSFYSQEINRLSEIVDKFDVYKWAVRTRLVNADLLVKDVMKIEKKLVKMGATGETTEEIIASAQEIRDRLELAGKSTKEIEGLLEDLEDDIAALSSVDPKRVAGIKSILAHKSSLSALKGVVTKAKKSGQGNVEAAQAKYDEAKLALDTEIAEFGAKEYTVRQEYKDIEDKSELFTLDSHVFAQKYPDIWGYRTSRGAGLGKAITPYADARVFEIIQGVASGSASGVKTGDRNPMFKKEGDTDVQKILNRAIQNMAVQNLIGGMRFQSTSDFRYEYASDYLIALFEMQAMGANVQLYTKVVEAVDFFANAGCDVNLSVMPKNKGIGLLEAEPADWNERYSQYFTLENGKYKKVGNLESVPQWEAGKYYEILYSDVTGVNGAAARHFAQKYDNVQLIMVGINNNHINACLDSDDITFVIPFHGSGNKTADIQQMMKLLGEDIAVEEVTDFGAFESDFNDTTIKNPNDERLQRRSLREQIVSGKMLDEEGNRRELTPEEQKLLKEHPLLRDLYKRFYVDAPDANGKLNVVTEFQDADLQNIFEGMNHDEFKKKYYLNGVNECYGHFLSGDTAKKIFPYEYWDKSLTQSEAKANGDAFQQYCKDLGLLPRFTGFNSKNSYKADADFSKNPNYWKLLIDRKMYDNRGNYRAQQKISLSKFGMSDEADYDFSTLNPGYGDIIFGDNGVLSNEVNPKTDEMRAKEKSNAIMSKSNDRKATEKIVAEAKQHIENARAESAKKNKKEGQRPPENAFAMDEDVWKAYKDDHPDLAAKMIQSGVMEPAAGVRLEEDENGKPRLVVDEVKPTEGIQARRLSLAKDDASALTAEVKDYFKGIPRTNNFYLSAKEIEDMMEVNPYGDQEMDNAEQIVMNLSELSKLQSGDDQVRTWGLMEKVLPYLSVYAQGNWIEDRWSQNPDFTNWYNQSHPDLYYPGYQTGDLNIAKVGFDKYTENRRKELNHLESIIENEDFEKVREEAVRLQDAISNQLSHYDPDSKYGSHYAMYSLAQTYQDYEDAFWGDDEEWMRECVDEAARANGYTKKAYHGTMKYGFNEFWDVSRRELGVHLGTEEAANVFYNRALAMGQNAGIYEVFVKMENTLRTPDIWGTYTGLMDLVDGVDEWIKYGYNRGGDGIDTKWTRADSEKLKKLLVKNEDYTKYLTAVYQARAAAVDYKNGKTSLRAKENAMRNANLAAQTYLKNLGYDSIRYINEAEDAGNESYIILKPENIKSADTVTYGPDGNHVPLAERFNDSTRDIRYSLVGVAPNGMEVYETSEDVKKMSAAERIAMFENRMENEYRNKTARFTRNGHTYYATLDKAGIKKSFYGSGDAGSQPWKAKTRIAAEGDIFDLLSDSEFYDSEAERAGKKGRAHTQDQRWDYYVKKVQIDNKVYDLYADVRRATDDQGHTGPDNNFVYKFRLFEDKNTKAVDSANLTRPSDLSAEPTAENNIPQTAEESNGQDYGTQANEEMEERLNRQYSLATEEEVFEINTDEAKYGLNFRDPTGEHLARVFEEGENRKKYETRNYNEKRGNGQIKSAYLNTPTGIVQTGAGPAQLVGYWELGDALDGEPKDYQWLNDHATELGNDGTDFAAQPGDLKWVYPIKGAVQVEPTPVPTRGIQARRLYSLAPLTPAQQENYDFNQNQTIVGGQLNHLSGTKQRRYGGTKENLYADGVGKMISGTTGPQIYFHKNYAADVIKDQDLLDRAIARLEEEYPDFEYNCMMYTPKTGAIRFDEAPDFDTAREPIPGNVITVKADGEVVKGSRTYNRPGDIWHHKWQWVKNDYTGFDVEESWNWSKEYLNTLRPVDASDYTFSNNKGKGSFAQRGIPDAAVWDEQLDYFGLPHDSTGKGRYSLVPVRPIRPSSDLWERSHTTEEALAIYSKMWVENDQTREEAERAREEYKKALQKKEAEVGHKLEGDELKEFQKKYRKTKHSTQRDATVSTYGKIYDMIVKDHGGEFHGKILDASSGLGLGTDLGRERFGDNAVDDIEPYPAPYYEPRLGRDYSKVFGTYDAIISSAVLNVIPQDQRDALVIKMGQMLKPGGKMYITTRGSKDDVDKLGDNPKNVKLGEHEYVETSFNAYQKGFTNEELKAYIEDALGPDFSVVTSSKMGKAGVIVTRTGDEGTENKWSYNVGENYGMDSFFAYSLAKPVDVFGDEVSVDTTELTDFTPSELSDDLVYANDNAYYRTPDGQTVVIENVTEDSPEAEYFNLLENYDNANSSNTTAEKPYTIPQATRDEPDGYNLREQDAGLRRGSEEVPAEYQEGTLRRAGSPAERNEARGSQSAEEESLRYSIVEPDHYSSTGRPVYRNSKGDYNARITEEGEEVTTADAYPIGSIEHDLIKAWTNGDWAKFEDSINKLVEETDEATMQENIELLRQVTAIDEVLSENEKKALNKRLSDLLKKYGEMQRSKGAKKRNPKYVLAAKTDDTHKIMRNLETHGQNTEEGDELLTDQITKLALQDARMSYVPQSNAESIAKAKQLFASEGSFDNAAAYIDGLVKSGKRITPEDVALGELLIMDAGEIRDLTAFSELVANFAILSHEYGQVLQAFQLLRKLTPGGQLLYMQKVVDKLNKDYQKRIENPRDPMKKIEISQTDIEAIKNSHTRAELDKAVENLKQNIANQIPATAMDKWNSWRYLAMLGNPRTHIRNILGNMAFAPAVFLKDAYARGFEKKYIADGARNRIGGAKLDKNNPYMQLAFDDFQAMQKIVAGEAGGNKYTDANEIQQLRRIFNSDFMNQVAKANGNALSQEDIWFMEKYYTRAWAEFMQARGLTVEQVKALGDSPETRKLLQEARVWATQEAQRNTYHDANALASTLNRLKRQNGVSFVLLEGLVPFTKTPANILKRAIEYSPYGLISGMVQLRRDLAAGRSANEAVNRLAAGWSGTTIIALGILLRALGALRGAGSDDPEEEKFEKLQGRQQWSIEVPWFGGKRASYTIDWMAPTALPLFIGASAYDLFDSARDKGLGAWNAWELAELMTRLVDPMLSLSMLDGIENTISSVANAQGASKLSTLMTSMFLSYAAQGMPTVAGQIARTFDPSRRSTYIDKNSTTPSSLQRFWQSSVQSKIPGYEAERMAYVDEWGRTDSKKTAGEWFWGAFENFLSPGYGNVINTTAVDEELNRLYEATGDKGVLPDAAAKYFNEVIDGLSQRKELTADEYEKLQMTRGQTAFSVISDLIASAEYESLSDADKAKLIGNAYTYADQMAKNDISDLYAEDKWVDLAKRVGAVDYLLIKTDYDENRSNEKLFSWLVSNPNLNDRQIAELIANKYNAPAEVKSVSTFGYVYEVTDADEDAMGEIISSLVNERLSELRRSDQYIEADNAEKGALMADLWAQAKEDAATIYGATLDNSGRAMTIGKASAVGSEAFHMVLDKAGTVADQSGWLGGKYRADSTIKNPMHAGYNLELTVDQERKLEQTFRAAWDVEYAKLLASDEFKNAPNRTYQDNMIADRYNATAASVEDSFATELYRSNGAAESFAKKPTGYTWGEAYTIATEHFSDTTEAGHWIAQKYSTGSTIAHPDRPGYDMVLTGAQQVEIQEDFDAAFVPAYNALLKSPEFKALSRESQENRINDLQKKVTAEVETSYGRKLIATGREFEQKLNLNSSYANIYTMLATENMTDASRKAVMKDKYDGGTVTNPAAKEYRKERYDVYIDQLWSKYIKTGAATEYEKLHKAAGDASGNDMKKKFGNVLKIGDVADLEYDIVVPEYDYTPQTYGTTYTSEGTTPYVIPAANYTNEQKNIMSKYGLVPNK